MYGLFAVFYYPPLITLYTEDFLACAGLLGRGTWIEFATSRILLLWEGPQCYVTGVVIRGVHFQSVCSKIRLAADLHQEFGREN